jgi:hypothetical protein
MKQRILLLFAICTLGCLQSKANDIEPGNPEKSINEVAGNIFDGDSKKALKEVTVTAYSANKKEKVSVKADETFQMRIEMIEADGFDLMPSPFQFFDTK